MGSKTLRNLLCSGFLLASCAQGQPPPATVARAAPAARDADVCLPPAQPVVAFNASSREAFAAWVHGELDHLAPCWTFRRSNTSDLHFEGSYGKRRSRHSYESGWRHCQNVPSTCEEQVRAALADHKRVLETYDAEPAADAAQLRPVVRDHETAASVALQVPGAFIEPVVGDLRLLLVVDMPATVSYVGAQQLGEVALDQAAAKDRAMQNLRAELGAVLDEVQTIEPGVIGQLKPHFFTSSLVVLHDVWTEPAARLDGQLFVAVPSPEVLFYGDLRDAKGVATVRGLVAKVHDSAPHPLSRELYRWTASGWEVVK